MSYHDAPRLWPIAVPFERRLAVSRRPRGWQWLEADVAGWRSLSVDLVVSMQEPAEAVELGLEREGEVCQAQGIEFVNHPIRDHGIPDDLTAMLTTAELCLERLRSGKRVAAHCYAGLGRSPLMVACILVRNGLDGETAWERISAARGHAVPEMEDQRIWLEGFERKVLGWG